MSKGNPFIPSVFLSFHLSCISFFFPFYAISFIKKTLITDKTVVWGSRFGQCFWRMTPCSLKFGNIFYHWVIDVICDLVLYFFSFVSLFFHYLWLLRILFFVSYRFSLHTVYWSSSIPYLLILSFIPASPSTAPCYSLTHSSSGLLISSYSSCSSKFTVLLMK